MSLRVCAEAGCPELVQSGRCQKHRRYSPTYLQRDTAERKRRKEFVDNWRATVGDWCPGWQREAHAATDLTADHITAVANGGKDSPLTVLCRSCNSRKQHR